MLVATTKFRMLTNQVAASLDAHDLRVLEVPHPLGGTDEATILEWADAAIDATIALFLKSAASSATGAPARAPAETSPSGDLDRNEVLAALEDVRTLVAADGGDIELASIGAGSVALRLILDTVECRECVMPRSFLEQVALDTMRSNLPGLDAVMIDDPRESSVSE